MGPITAHKMSVLPKLLYLFETLPVTAPSSHLRSSHRAFTNFIWHYKTHRIASSVLYPSKARGGLGVPDLTTMWLLIYVS